MLGSRVGSRSLESRGTREQRYYGAEVLGERGAREQREVLRSRGTGSSDPGSNCTRDQ